MDRCIDCGAELPAHRARCPECLAPAVGTRVVARVAVAVGARPTVPDVCCCCLAPREETVSTAVALDVDAELRVDVPWCHGCQQRASLVVLFLIAGPVALTTILVLVVWLLDPTARAMLALALLVGVAGGPILGLEMARRLDRRGHVPKCMAVGSRRQDAYHRGGERGGKLSFGNKAFAREWVRLNPRG